MYILDISCGKEPNLLEKVQTIQLDYQDNIDIHTKLLGYEDSKLHPNDKKYLEKINEKTKKIVKDIFTNKGDEMFETSINFDTADNKNIIEKQDDFEDIFIPEKPLSTINDKTGGYVKHKISDKTEKLT